MTGWLTLIGSGEIAPGMVKVHRALLNALGEPPRAVFLVTPAGFELGLEAIQDRFQEFFRTRLSIPLEIATYRQEGEDPALAAHALAAVLASNYILAGPGSPTYAVRQWRGSAVFGAVLERWLAGGQLIFASSAAIAVSRHVLPVYEISKVGQELHWADGLDLLGRYGLQLAIVSHWDNAEGGTHDTRACFMGLERFGRLRTMLPATAVVLGIDEHTACTLDVDEGTARVMGRGGVTILRGESTIRHQSGHSFPLTELQPLETVSTPTSLSTPRQPRQATVEASSMIASGDLAGGLRLAAQTAPAEIAAVLHQAAQAIEGLSPVDEPLAEWIGLLVETRAELRKAQQWALADWLRDRLSELGVTLQDTPEGTVWERGA